MKVGDLVKIKQGHLLSDKVAIIINKGTWSMDILIFDNGWKRRLAKEKLEVISESR
tara:strand:+ start:365 stop:532 length:168 start_codon:yes stop_codon:yes gene_type:complete